MPGCDRTSTSRLPGRPARRRPRCAVRPPRSRAGRRAPGSRSSSRACRGRRCRSRRARAVSSANSSRLPPIPSPWRSGSTATFSISSRSANSTRTIRPATSPRLLGDEDQVAAHLLRVVGVHRARTHADPLDVDAVGALDDRLDRRQVGRVGWAGSSLCLRVCHARALKQEKAPATPGPAIRLAGLRRDYGERTALDGVGRRARRRRDAGRARAQRRRQDDAAADPRDAAAPERRRGPGARLRAAGRGLEAARADRLPRPRAAALPRPQRPREPRASTRRLHGIAGGGRRGADRRAARRGRDGAPRRRAGRRALGRDAPAAGDLPLRPARAGAAAARRARLQPRRRGPRAGPGADRPRRRPHPRRRHPRPRALPARGRPGAAARRSAAAALA